MIAYRAPQDGQAGRPTEQPAAHRHCPRGENWQTRHLEGVVLRERLTGSRPVAGTRSKAPVAELADAPDSKSDEQRCSCGFEARLAHHELRRRRAHRPGRIIRSLVGAAPYTRCWRNWQTQPV